MGVKDVGVNANKKRESVIGVKRRVCAVEKDIKEMASTRERETKDTAASRSRDSKDVAATGV